MMRTLRVLITACCLVIGLVGCGTEDPPKGDTDGGGTTQTDGGEPDAGESDAGTERPCENNPCGENSTCIIGNNNEPLCGCEAGYVRIDNACVREICAENNGGCHADAICSPSVDNLDRTCSCKTGFLGDGLFCEADPCFQNGQCGANSTCRIGPNSTFECECAVGFIPDGNNGCYPDRCNPNPCGANSVCTNSPEGPVCTCKPNYHKEGDTCVVDRPCDEPSSVQCGANSTCANQPDGTHKCVCDQGYEQNGPSCVPYNPCHFTECPSNSTCNVRNFQAFCDCDTGYVPGDEGDTCVDDNECDQGDICGAAYDCVNKVGSYECACKEGTIGDEESGCRAGYASKPANGRKHTCAVATDGTLWCWGSNDSGQLAQPRPVPPATVPKQLSPYQVGTDTDWSSVASGDDHTCAIKTDGSLWCWGQNNDGQVGNGQHYIPGQSPWWWVTTPTRVVGNWGDVKAVAAGVRFTCALRAYPGENDRSLWCWGHEEDGRLGRPVTGMGAVEAHFPGQVGTDTDWSQLAAGDGHACGLKNDGRLFCWGQNSLGQLGIGSTTSQDAPVQVADPVPMSVVWTAVSSFGTTTCALAQGEAYCWGNNNYGQAVFVGGPFLQVPTLTSSATDWTDIAVGTRHTCGVRHASGAGETWCWGLNNSGQAGVCASPAPPTSVTPPQKLTGTGWRYVGAGEAHSCGVFSNGQLWCWGNNSDGQLGNGTQFNACYPTPAE